MDRFLINISNESASPQTTKNETISHYDGTNFSSQVVVQKSYGDSRLTVWYYKNKFNGLEPHFYDDGTFWYVLSGYVVEELTSENISKYFSCKHDCRPVTISLGGIYSYVTIRKRDGQISAGSSLPSIEPIYYQLFNTRKELNISNNALLAHISSLPENVSTPDTRENYIFEALAGGGISGSRNTPFNQCFRLEASSQLVGHLNAEPQVIKVAKPSYGNLSTVGYKNRVNGFIDCLNYSASLFKKLPPSLFQLSGGRDSRMLAAMFKANNIDVIPENLSLPWTKCGQISGKIANILGHESCFNPLDYAFPENITFTELTQEKVKYQSGLPLIASPQYASRLGGRLPGHPMVYGHAHLQRGGLRMAKNVNKAQEILIDRMLNPSLSEPFYQTSKKKYTDYISQKINSGKTIPSLSQHSYFDFVLNYQYSSFQSYFQNWHPSIMPLLDERFSLYCLDIADSPSKGKSIISKFSSKIFPQTSEYAGIIDLHLDALAMDATYEMCPQLMEFPLAENRYRAEKVRPFSRGNASKTFDLRNPNLVKHGNPPTDHKQRNYYPPLDVIARHLWEYACDNKLESLIEETTRPDLVRWISSKDKHMPNTISLKQAKAHIWSCYGLLTIINNDWIN